MRRSKCAAIVTGWLVAVVACGNSNTRPPVQPSTTPGAVVTLTPSKRVLVVTHTAGFRHDSIPTAEATLADIGSTSQLYQTDFCRTADDVKRVLTRDGLSRYDAVFFANTTGHLGIPDVGAFLQWIAEGGGFVGAHSAADTYHESAEFIAMLGGEFEAHGSIAEADVRVDDPTHPAVAHLTPRFRITDELYRFSRFDRANVRVLLSLDRNPPDGLGVAGAPADLPMAWHRAHGTGRVFYTAFGHRSEVWRDARFQQHLREAIRWVLKL